MRPKKRTGFCVYCGAFGKLTRDHIPPRCLTPPSPMSGDLLTVPCCENCNRRASLDDEYFRLALASREDLEEHAAIQEIIPAVERSLERSSAAGLFRDIANNVQMTDVYSRGGVFLRQAPVFKVNLRRLNKVAARIVRGLYYHELRDRLPDEYDVAAYAESGLSQVDQATMDKLRGWCASLRQSPPKCKGGVLTYWFCRTPSDPRTTFWVLNFYNKVTFVGWTFPRQPAGRANGVGRR
jgi:hypothetical protein